MSFWGAPSLLSENYSSRRCDPSFRSVRLPGWGNLNIEDSDSPFFERKMERDLFSFYLPSSIFYRSSYPKHGILDGKKKWIKKVKKKGVKTEWCVAFGFSEADEEEKDNGETIMPRSQRNDNFIDKTFTVVADILLKVLPTSQREKQAFMYYRDGMSAQSLESMRRHCKTIIKRCDLKPMHMIGVIYCTTLG